MHSFFIEVNPGEKLSDAVWKLDENERVQFVYVLQSKNFKKASREFLEVSREYTQVMGAYCIFVALEICEKLVLKIYGVLFSHIEHLSLSFSLSLA